MASADAPSAISRRSTGNGTLASFSAYAGKPSRLTTITCRLRSAALSAHAAAARKRTVFIPLSVYFDPRWVRGFLIYQQLTCFFSNHHGSAAAVYLDGGRSC